VAFTAQCVTWATHRSAPDLGRSKVQPKARLVYPLVFDRRTLLRPRTAALRPWRNCGRGAKLLDKFCANITLSEHLMNTLARDIRNVVRGRGCDRLHYAPWNIAKHDALAKL